MCGIYGSVAAAGEPAPMPWASGRLAHRGPDGAGEAVVDLGWGRARLGMTRLAITGGLDIPVPFRFRSHPHLTLAFNGEVYNLAELRAELHGGLGWKTGCDAEVVVRAWERWGPGMLPRLNGMWGLAVADARRGQLFLARDRAGEKPLYTFAAPGGVRFASEAKALADVLAPTACEDLAFFEADCLEATPLADAFAMPPGYAMLLERPEHAACYARWEPWWELPTAAPDPTLRRPEAAAGALADVLRRAIVDRVPDEVPWALQLSGGVDSACVQAVTRHERLYTVTFPEADNLPGARAAALGAPVRPVTFGLADLDRDLERVAWHLDTPATWTAVCQWFMARAMAGDGAKVVLTGEGADELFGGYARYRALWHVGRARRDPLLAAYGPLLRHAVGSDDDLLDRLSDRSGRMPRRAAVLRDRLAGAGEAWVRMARLDWHATMQILLRMADRMNAAFAVENRAPFLDHRVVELAARIPSELKIDDRWTKAVLRDAAELLGVAPEVAREPTKRGLYLPWSSWTGATGARGAWDRASFAARMRAAWRRAYGFGDETA